MLLDADEFITKYELYDVREILRKGALLAHDPTNVVYVEELRQASAETHTGAIPSRPPSIGSLVRCVLFAVAAIA